MTSPPPRTISCTKTPSIWTPGTPRPTPPPIAPPPAPNHLRHKDPVNMDARPPPPDPLHYTLKGPAHFIGPLQPQPHPPDVRLMEYVGRRHLQHHRVTNLFGCLYGRTPGSSQYTLWQSKSIGGNYLPCIT